MTQPRQILSTHRCFPEQSAVLANDLGIDVVIAGVGGGKSWIAALKMLFWALRHPRQRNGRPTEWLVMGRDYALCREVQLAEILNHCRNLATWGPSCELEIRDAQGPASVGASVYSPDGEPSTLTDPTGYHRPAALVEEWLEGARYRVRPLLPVDETAIVRRAVGGQRPEIELMSGSLFRGFSSTDVDRIRGFGFNGAWMDEAEYQYESGFEMALNRQRAAIGRRLIVTSSPAAAGQGWLWQVISGKFPRWDPVRVANEVRVHRWASDDNPTLTTEQLAGIRASMEAISPGKSAAELDGLFLGTEEAPGHGPIDYTRAFVGRVKPTTDDLKAECIGVDIGEVEDFTWIVVLSQTGLVLDLQRFNVSVPGVPRQGFYPYLENRIEQTAAKWNAKKLVIDAAKAGIGVIQHIEQKLKNSRKVESYNTDAPNRKSAAIEALGTAVARGDVRVPTAIINADGSERVVEWTEYLRREFSELLVTEAGPGRRRFTHPQGGHDDGIVALALAWQGIAGRPAPVSDYSAWKTVGSSGPRFGGGFAGRFTR